MRNVSIISIATVTMLSISASCAASTKACESVSLSDLKQELQGCISRTKVSDNATKWNACLVRVFNCADISTVSSGLSADVKILGIFSSHRDQFFVDQRAYHFREVRDRDSVYQVGFGYQISVKQKDWNGSANGSFHSIAESLSTNAPQTYSFVGIAGLDPASINDDTVYKLLSISTANVQASDFINTATKVEQKFSNLYDDIHDGKDPQPKVRLCPQVLAMRPVVAGAPAAQFAQAVETALCPAEAQGRRASGVFLYSFGDKGDGLTSNVGPSADVDVDHIKLTYARRRYYTLKSPSDLHAEYYATGDKGSFGSGSLFAALLSMSGSNNTISNTDFEYGYAACLGDMPAIDDTRTTTQTLPQMQGLANLYIRFNAAMSQIDGWAVVPDSGAAACDGSSFGAQPPVVASEAKPPQALPRGTDSR